MFLFEEVASRAFNQGGAQILVDGLASSEKSESLLGLINMRGQLLPVLRNAKHAQFRNAKEHRGGVYTQLVALETQIKQELQRILTNSEHGAEDTNIHNNKLGAKGVNVGLCRITYEHSDTRILQKVYWYERVLPYASHEVTD
jgi:hypothetical protein